MENRTPRTSGEPVQGGKTNCLQNSTSCPRSQAAERPNLTPDRDQAERFLRLLDEDAERFTFQTFDDSKGREDERLTRVLNGTLDKHWQALCALNRKGAGVYVTVNETDLQGRKKTNITRVRALFQEQDRAGCPELPTAPHIVVESSPGKHHRYILVDGCYLDGFGPLQERLVQDYGSDPDAKDISRVLRLPGFYHMKNPDTPHLVRIVEESGELPLPYAEAMRIFPPVIRKPRPAPVDTGAPPRLAEVQSALSALNPDIPYTEWLSVGMALHEWSGGSAAGLETWGTWSANGTSYRPGECTYKWGTFDTGGGVTIKTVFGMAAKSGWRWQGRSDPDDPADDFADHQDGEAGPADPNPVIQALAAASTVEYEQRRVEAAKALGIRTNALDQLVKKARKVEKDSDLPFEETEPWPVKVKADQLLSEISATIRRFIVCTREVADAVSLWVAMTWFMDVVQVAPLAVITAPEKRCGKTQLLSVLARLVARAIAASSISPAALYRAIDAWNPTLLIDEADAFMKDNEELRGIINSGHTRDSAYVIRTVGDDHIPTKFRTWGAKAIAGIGHVADTLMDRAIVLELRRKLMHEDVERLRYAEPDLFITLRSKLARFAADYSEQVRAARPPLPASLNDRAQDNWEPLLAIAVVAGGNWLEIGTTAALKLSGTESATQAIGTELLADIQEVFELRGTDRISTANLIKALCEDDERPWSSLLRGNPITPRKLATMLKGYGICSGTIRIGTSTPKGFLLDQFTETFTRYLTPPEKSATTPQPSTDGHLRVADKKVLPQQTPLSATSSVADNPQRCGYVADSQDDISSFFGDCCGVADNSTPPEKDIFEEEI